MAEKPILFSTPMVQAILAGRKTQTRRIIKPQPIGEQGVDWAFTASHIGKNAAGILQYNTNPFITCPYGKSGDTLWVRETWQIKNGGGRVYKADGVSGFLEAYPNEVKENYSLMKWKPSIHMPRAASRITLEITNIRVERLRNISNDDAFAEGMSRELGHELNLALPESVEATDYRHIFMNLWQKINGNWNANPWVWVVEFKKV